jgi:uncharacterized protein (DUF58 family)
VIFSIRARIVLALFLLSLFGALATGRDLFYNLSYLWAGLLISSWLWARSALSGLIIKREPRSNRAQVGQLFVERFLLRNTSRIPKLWLEVRDTSDLPGYQVTTVTIGLGFRGKSDIEGHRMATVTVGLGPGRQRSWMARTLCTRRGRYRLGPILVQSADPFGLFPVTEQIPQSQHLVVLPMTVPVWSFPLPSGRLPGGDALRRRTHQITPNAVTVRDYAPGDSYNRIHWPSTAKQARLIVKEFEIDPYADVWLVLDAERDVQLNLPEEQIRAPEDFESTNLYQLPPSTEEYSVSVVASLALHFLQRDRAVGLITYGAVRTSIQPDRGESQLFRMLESLAVLEAQGRNRLDEVIKVEGPAIPRGSTVILVTPAVDERFLSTAKQLEYGGRSVVLVLLEAESFGGATSSRGLINAARRLGFPVRLVQNGDPLTEALSSPIATGRLPEAA